MYILVCVCCHIFSTLNLESVSFSQPTFNRLSLMNLSLSLHTCFGILLMTTFSSSQHLLEYLVIRSFGSTTIASLCPLKTCLNHLSRPTLICLQSASLDDGKYCSSSSVNSSIDNKSILTSSLLPCLSCRCFVL